MGKKKKNKKKPVAVSHETYLSNLRDKIEIEMAALRKAAELNLGKTHYPPLPESYTNKIPGGATLIGTFGVEYCAGSAFVLGLDGTRWFTTTQLRAETIATVLNAHLDEYATVRADVLKRKGGVEVG